MYPERQAEQQQRGDWQVNLSYLLGLDWQIPFEFQKVRGRERTLEELKKAAKGGAFGELMGTVAELRPQVTVAGGTEGWRYEAPSLHRDGSADESGIAIIPRAE